MLLQNLLQTLYRRITIIIILRYTILMHNIPMYKINAVQSRKLQQN